MANKTKEDADDEIHAEIFRRINTLESKVDVTNGYLKGVVESNNKVVQVNERIIQLMENRDVLFWRIVVILSFITLISIGAVIYGAIGKEGLHSVRQTLPPITSAAIPAHNDLDKWMYLRHLIEHPLQTA